MKGVPINVPINSLIFYVAHLKATDCITLEAQILKCGSAKEHANELTVELRVQTSIV